MKILHVLPELQIGGVERHVVDLANELRARGHAVGVVSRGGRMESQLADGVRRLRMPVHRKNPLTAYVCACRIAKLVAAEGWDLLHAHSRVPAWIAMWASRMSGAPCVVTAHCEFGHKMPWIYVPYRRAARVICVGESVREAMKSCFYANTTVIVNGVKAPGERWNPEMSGRGRLLFVGRLSDAKGLQDVLKALPADCPWTLDVVGEGPARGDWEAICRERGIAGRVTFHGYSDQVGRFMANASCLLFPSYKEGMPLTLAQAAIVGVPVLASDIASVAELKGDSKGLVPVGDVDAWKRAFETHLRRGRPFPVFPGGRVPTLARMVDQTLDVYRGCLSRFSAR